MVKFCNNKFYLIGGIIIKVIFNFSGALKRKFKQTNLEIEIEPGKTIAEALLDMDYELEDLKYLVAFKNQIKIPLTSKLEAGDEIKILLPIGGG